MALTLRSGRIDYLSPAGAVRGQEWLQITRDSAGVLTGRSLAMTFDSAFVRDVTISLSRDHHLLDACVRLRVGTKAVGTGYYVNRDGILGVVADVSSGREEQAVILVPPYTFGTHAVAFDAWHFFHYDHARGGSQQINAFTTSLTWNGTDRLLGALTRHTITKESTDVVRVRAGEFETTRWRLVGEVAVGEGLIVWTHSEDRVLVKLEWPERGLRYELAEYSEQRLPVP